MTATELLNDCRARGIALEAAGPELRVKARRGALTEGVLAALKARKPELLALLSYGPAAPDREPVTEVDRIAWRAESMRRTGAAVAFLAMDWAPGVGCYSCGAEGAALRCEPCREALRMVTAERRRAAARRA